MLQNKSSLSSEYPVPKVTLTDVLKALTLAIPMFVVFTAIMLFLFNPYLIPIGIIIMGALTFQLSREMMMSRYLKKNRHWLEPLAPKTPEDLKPSRSAMRREVIFGFITLTIGAVITGVFTSGVGAMMMVYPICTALSRATSYKQRSLLGFYRPSLDIFMHPNFKLRIPGMFVAALLIAVSFSPPGIIGLTGILAVIAMNLFIVSMMTYMINQSIMHANLSKVVDTANLDIRFSHLYRFRNAPKPELEREADPDLDLQAALKQKDWKTSLKTLPALKLVSKNNSDEKPRSDQDLIQDMVKPRLIRSKSF